METGRTDYANKEWLRELNRDESERGFLGLMPTFRDVLAAIAILLLVAVAVA